MKNTIQTVRLLVVSLLLIVFMSGCSSLGSAMKASPTLTNAMGVADIPLEDLKAIYEDENSKYVQVNGMNIHYRDVGEGETIVLVHGIMSSLHTWDEWTEELEQSYRVISLDLPGYGLTGAPENIEDFNEAHLLNSFAKFIDALGLDHFTLAGNSLGGYVAAQYASSYPSRVNKLILLDPVAYPQDTPWIMDLATLPGVRHLGQLVQPPLFVTMNVKETYGEPSRIKDKHMSRYVHMAQRPGAKAAYIKTFDMLVERSTQEKPMPFHRISAPTLLMWGEKDIWVPTKMAERWLEDIPSSVLKVYPTVGHMPMEEIPETTVKDAIAFMNNQRIVPTQIDENGQMVAANDDEFEEAAN